MSFAIKNTFYLLSFIFTLMTPMAYGAQQNDNPILLYHFVLSPDNTTMYAIDLDPYTPAIYVADSNTGKTIKKIVTPHRSPYILAPSFDGKSLFVSYAANFISKIDTLNNQIVTNIYMDQDSTDFAMAFTPNDKQLYTADRYNKKNSPAYIHAIDVEKNILSQAIPKNSSKEVNLGFTAITLDHLGQTAYLADNSNGSIAQLKLDQNKLQLNSITGVKFISEMVIDSSNKKLFATETYENDLVIIDLATKKITSKIKTGEMPHGLAITPDNAKIYIANQNSHTISVYSVEQNKMIGEIPMKSPLFVRITSDGKKAYLANMFGQVLIIDTKTDKVISSISFKK